MDRDQDYWQHRAEAAEQAAGSFLRKANEHSATLAAVREQIKVALAELTGVDPDDKYERECLVAAINVLNRVLDPDPSGEGE